MFDFVAHKRWYFLLSAFLTIPGLIFILLGGLKPSVDFTGGTVWESGADANPVAHAERRGHRRTIAGSQRQPSAGSGACARHAVRRPGGGARAALRRARGRRATQRADRGAAHRR